MSQTQTVARRDDRENLESLLTRPGYQKRFMEVLKDRAPQFMSSILSIGRSMPDVEPKSIVASAMIAATLDLPIEKNLGFAWIVPYRDGERKYAQFQMGYKGYIQLALRTGRYERMNARPINKEALGGFDEVGEPIIDWSKVDETKEAVGYAFGFKLIGGFVKVCYWPKEKVQQHAQRYSQAYRKGGQTPWKTEFDKMALKTVIGNEISDWGILSVEWQVARRADQGVVRDIDAEVEYVDNNNALEVEDRKPEPTAHQKATATAAPAPTQAPQPQPAQQATAAQPAKTPEPEDDVPMGETTTVPPKAPESPQDSPQPAQAPQTASAPESPRPAHAAAQEAAPAAPGQPPAPVQPPIEPSNDPALNPQQGDSDAVLSIKVQLKQAGIPFAQFRAFLLTKKLIKEAQPDLRALSAARADAINRSVSDWLEEIRKVAV